MNLIELWALGRKLLELRALVQRARQHIDLPTLRRVGSEVFELEQKQPNPESGAEKLTKLIDWFSRSYPEYSRHVDLISAIVSGLVWIYNAVGIFRKGAA